MIKNAGKIFITVGIVCILLSLAFLTYNFVENNSVKDNTRTIVTKFIENIDDSKIINITDKKSKLKTITIDGNNYIGYLSIPALDITLPVMKNWSYDNLKISPCCYSGNPNKKGFVIAGHNYSCHFGRLSDLHNGDKVTFVDSVNQIYEYTVKSIEVLSADGIEEMTDDSWDLTLFTCNYYGNARVTVRLLSD